MNTTSDRSDIHSRLERFLLSELSAADRERIAADEDLLVAGLLDSLGVLQLTSFLEESFAVSVDADDVVADNFRSIDSLIDLVLRKMAG